MGLTRADTSQAAGLLRKFWTDFYEMFLEEESDLEVIQFLFHVHPGAVSFSLDSSERRWV